MIFCISPQASDDSCIYVDHIRLDTPPVHLNLFRSYGQRASCSPNLFMVLSYQTHMCLMTARDYTLTDVTLPLILFIRQSMRCLSRNDAKNRTIAVGDRTLELLLETLKSKITQTIHRTRLANGVRENEPHVMLWYVIFPSTYVIDHCVTSRPNSPFKLNQQRNGRLSNFQQPCSSIWHYTSYGMLRVLFLRLVFAYVWQPSL